MDFFFKSPSTAAQPVYIDPFPTGLCGTRDVEFEVGFPDDARAELFCAFLKSELPEMRASRPAVEHPEDLRLVNCAVLIMPNCGSIDDYEAMLEVNAERLHGRVEGWAIRT